MRTAREKSRIALCRLLSRNRRCALQAARRQPQVVTRHGREVVVVMSVERYRQLARQQPNLVDFLARSPLAEAFAAGELELARSRDLPREIAL